MEYILYALCFCCLLAPAYMGYMFNDFIELYNIRNYFGETNLADIGLLSFDAILGATAILILILMW